MDARLPDNERFRLVVNGQDEKAKRELDFKARQLNPDCADCQDLPSGYFRQHDIVECKACGWRYEYSWTMFGSGFYFKRMKKFFGRWLS